MRSTLVPVSRKAGPYLLPEAMACGCAFVAPISVGSVTMRPTATALLSAPGDRDGLLQNLIRITENAPLRRHIQSRGTENIHQFTWEVAGNAMETYFQEHWPRTVYLTLPLECQSRRSTGEFGEKLKLRRGLRESRRPRRFCA